MKRLLALCLAAVALGGCESRPITRSVSPRMTGRVLAADTGQPLADVKIMRDQQAVESRSTMPAKGGAALRAKAVARTDPEGRFVLDNESVLFPFGGSSWFSVQLVFERAGYERFQTNYTYMNLGTNSLNGEMVLSTGDIRLQPARK